MKTIPQLSDKDIARNNTVYDSYYRLQIIDAWDDEDKAYNFSHMVRIADFTKFPLNDSAVLDVGCGTGDLLPVLRRHKIKQYLGVDIYEPALEKARAKFPDVDFRFADIIAGDITGTFDFVFCSGALSIKLLDTDNYDFLESMISAMWDLTRRGLVFNFMTDEDDDPDPQLFYYAKKKVTEICKAIAPDAKVVCIDTPLMQNGRVTDTQAHIYLYT